MVSKANLKEIEADGNSLIRANGCAASAHCYAKYQGLSLVTLTVYADLDLMIAFDVLRKMMEEKYDCVIKIYYNKI